MSLPDTVESKSSVRLLQVHASLLKRNYEEALGLLSRAAFLTPDSVEVYKLRS